MLILLSKIRKNLLWICLIPSLVVFFLFIIATLVGGRFDGIEGGVWTWFAVVFLPLLGILLVAAIQNRNSGKFIYKPVFSIIRLVTSLYILSTLFVVLTMGSGMTEGGVVGHFEKSYFYLLPFNFLLCLVFLLLFYKKEAIFLPNEKIIKNHAVGLLNSARSKNNVKQQVALEQLVATNYEGVFDTLQIFFTTNSIYESEHSQSILLENQYNTIRNQLLQGLIDNKSAQLSFNRITLATIELIKKIEP